MHNILAPEFLISASPRAQKSKARGVAGGSNWDARRRAYRPVSLQQAMANTSADLQQAMAKTAAAATEILAAFDEAQEWNEIRRRVSSLSVSHSMRPLLLLSWPL